MKNRLTTRSIQARCSKRDVRTWLELTRQKLRYHQMAFQPESTPMNELQLSGSCLCGSVRYEIAGTAPRFYHCHCQRCRKATGTGHASNVILQSTSLTWVAGEERLLRYDVPEAKRFAIVFCSTCGSSMPRVSPEAGIVVIPAGSLDHDPGIVPEARIFSSSRADWSCSDSTIPCYDQYPE